MRTFRSVVMLALLSVGGLAGSAHYASSAEFDAEGVLGNTPILFTVRPPDVVGTHHYLVPAMFGNKVGSELKVLDPANGKTRVLVSAPEGIIRRPCVHFDGRRILFSMCRTRDDRFHIYELEVDPEKLFAEEKQLEPKQLTCAPDVDDVDPIYLPDGKIAFCSSRDFKIVPCDVQTVPQIFAMDADGANIHQITRSAVHENELSLMPDGRILYSRWDYVDRNFGDGHGFWVTNPDGTNQAILYGNNTAHPAAPWTARAIPGTSKIICVLGNHHGPLGGGLAIINTASAIDGHEPIERTWPADLIELFTPEENETYAPQSKHGALYSIWPKEALELVPSSGDFVMHKKNDSVKNHTPWYNCPFPLSERHFLYVVSRNSKAAAAIYLGDVDGNEVKLYEEGPGCYDPMPLAPSPKPTHIASTRDYGNNEGHFYIQDVYVGTHMEKVEAGSVKYVRVVQAHSKRGQARQIWQALGRQEGAIGWSGFLAKSVLGTAPVEEDGSASFMCPSDRFVYFQLLDKDGMMVHSMRSGTMIHSGERRGCIGCHESRTQSLESSVPGKMTMALRREPSRLTPWQGRTQRFNYLTEVQPIFDKHCIECHDFGKKGAEKVILAGDRNMAFNISYCELQSKGYTGAIGAGPAAHLPALTWGSQVSPLIAHLRKGHNDVNLSQEEMDTLITWIDLNAPYYPTGSNARPGPGPARNPLSADQTKRLFQLTGIKEDMLKYASQYKSPMITFDRPELSPCLQTIESEEAREEALAIIQAGKDSLGNLPRADSPEDFRPYETDAMRKAHNDKYRAIEQKVREAIRNGEKVYDSPEADPITKSVR